MTHHIQRAINDEKYSLAFDILKERRMEIELIDNSIKRDALIKDLDSNLRGIVNLQTLPEKDLLKKKDVYMDIKDVYERCIEQGQVPKFRVGRVGKRWVDKTKVKIVNSEFWVVNINWHFYKQMLITANKGYLVKKFNIEECLGDFKKIKQLSTYMLVNGPSIKDFNYIVGIEQLFGFNVQVQGTSSLSEVRNWVSKKFSPNLNGSESDYLTEFRKKVKEVLHHGRKSDKLECTISAAQFCNNIVLTGTSGSAFDPGGELPSFQVYGDSIRYKKNKFSKSVALSLENKINRLFKIAPILHKVNDKIEVYPKRRIIVSSDYNSTLKMRFVDQWLSEWLNGNDYSSLWRNKKQTKSLWMEFMSRVNTGEWNIPIDQSAFDHHVSKNMVLIILEEIKRLVEESMISSVPGMRQEYIDVMESIILGLKQGKVIYMLKEEDEGYIQGKTTNIELDWENGVLSGWQWTSKINTIANIAEGLLAIDTCRPLSIKTTQFDATGDDQNTTWKYLSDGMLYWLSLTGSGYQIHPSKNFFSQVHNEYLRLFSDSNGINGYPARNINKILWVYPGDIEDRTYSGRLNGTFDKWDKFRSRLRLNWGDIVEYLKDDLLGQRLPNKLVNTFMFGNILNNNKQLRPQHVLDGIVNYIPGTWLYHVNIHGEGYENFKAFFGNNQESELDKWILDTCGVDSETKKGLKIKSNQEVVINEGNSILFSVDQANYSIREEKQRIRKPPLRPGWGIGDIFVTSQTVMQEAFAISDDYHKKVNLPKSWYYDYITGRVDLIYPAISNCSQAGARLLCREYENSAYNAMLYKKTKENKWLSIVKKYFYHISSKIDEILGGKVFNI